MRFALAIGLGICVSVTAAAVVPAAIVPAEAQQAQRKKPADKKAEKKKKAPTYRIGDLTLSQIWSHHSTGRNGAAFLRINNAGEDDDALIDASTPIAKRVELHGPAESGEAWKTSRVDEIPTVAKQDTVLTGLTLHLKLIGLRGALNAGEKVPITLTFERAGAITVQASVLSAEDAAAMIEKVTPSKPEAAPKKQRKRRKTRRRRP